MTRSPIALAAIALLASSACTSESHVATSGGADGSVGPGVDAGPERWSGDSGPTSSTSEAAGILTPKASCEDAPQEPEVAWDGWIEAVTFPSGSDRLRVSIEPDGAGGWTGFFLAGEGPHVDGVPRSADDCAFLCSGPLTDEIFIYRAIEGFRYELRNVTYSDLRLRFEIDSNEIVAAFCEAQTPVLDEHNTEEEQYNCIRNTGGSWDYGSYVCHLTPDDEDPIQIPCCRMALCDTVCDCTATECFARPTPAVFDLFIEGDVASGTTPFGTGHLQRVSP